MAQPLEKATSVEVDPGMIGNASLLRLCETCQRINIRLLPDPEDSRSGEIAAGRSGFKHSTAAELLRSSSTCDLCALIRASFLRVGCYHNPQELVDRSLKGSPDAAILLRAKRRDPGRASNGGANLTSIEPFLDLPGSDYLRGRLDLYSPPGSPAVLSGDVLQRALLTDTSPLKPSDLVRNWLDNCLESHPSCRRRFSGGFASSEDPDAGWPDAPARLVRIFLDNGGEREIIRPQLIASVDAVSQRGQGPVPKYVTLSHCWGPPTRRPLCTTSENLEEHMASIPWDKLPRTFQDTFEICTQLHIQYVWIDSLCIIQDDPQDWESEARKMGSVYENAHFTIAASSARDSSEGLFMVRQPLPMVSLRYQESTDVEPNARVYAYIEPEFEKALGAAPLSQRAWVYQEYFLSRRTAHFTKHGLVWICNGKRSPEDASARYMTSEFGEPQFPSFLETQWAGLVRSYSQRQLTFKTDKLIAIEGLRQHFRVKKPDGAYRHGLWLQDLPHDLLWYSREGLAQDIPTEVGIPSWSWASNTGPVSFKRWEFEDAESTCQRIEFSGVCDKHLIVNSYAKLVDEIRGPVQCQAFRYEDLVDMDFQGRLHDDYQAGSVQVSPTFLLLSGQQKVGWAVFDTFQAPTGQVYCLSLLRQNIWSWFGKSKEDHFLWVLILRGGGGIFERVGWGLVLVPSWLEGQARQDLILA